MCDPLANSLRDTTPDRRNVFPLYTAKIATQSNSRARIANRNDRELGGVDRNHDRRAHRVGGVAGKNGPQPDPDLR